MAEVKKFVNWSKEDFVGMWDSKPRIIKAGESIILPGFLADHYAKHLVDREIIRDGKEISLGIEAFRQPYLDKCFVGEVISAENELEAEIASLNVPEEIARTIEKPVAKKAIPAKNENVAFKDVI